MTVAVTVGSQVAVAVGVFVAVAVGVSVGLEVGVDVGVEVAVGARVNVGVALAVGMGVFVGNSAATVAVGAGLHAVLSSRPRLSTTMMANSESPLIFGLPPLGNLPAIAESRAVASRSGSPCAYTAGSIA